MLSDNFFCIGLLPERKIRFVLAGNADVTRTIAARHQASPQVSALMGEALLGAFFLASHSTKQRKLILSVHLECRGPVERIIAFATDQGGLRAMPSRPEASWPGDLHEGKGAGMMTVNRWLDDSQKAYSSSVEMRDTSLGKNLEEYVARSEQVNSFIGLSSEHDADGLVATTGYVFQAMPGSGATDVDAVLALIGKRNPQQVVTSLVGEPSGTLRPLTTTEPSVEKVKILLNGSFYDYCDCTRQKIERMLFLLGEKKVVEVLTEQGEVEVFCEFCRKRYQLDERAVESLFKRKPGDNA